MRLEAKIHTVRFRNEQNGYTVLTRKQQNGELQVIVGVFPPVHPGQEIVVEGEFVIDNKFGTQFKVSNIISLELSNCESIERFLASGVVTGIGPSTAKKIVEKFAERTFEVIEQDYRELTQIKGISLNKAEKIRESYKANKDMQAAIMFLQGLEIGVQRAINIYKFYGDKTIETISANPYRLVEDIEGIGFLTADRMALAEGFDLTSPFRVRAGIIHTLNVSSDSEGNTYLPYDKCVENTLVLLKVGDTQLVEDCIVDLVHHNKLKVIENQSLGKCVMHIKFYQAEREVASRLLFLIETANRQYSDHLLAIKEFELEFDISLHQKQKDAIQMAVQSGVCVITGGPGTGKTTIIKCIIRSLQNQNQNTVLLAPTGRAAKRLGESTGQESSTIHRYLLVDNESQKPVADCLIVDEVSMVDIFLMRNLLKSISQGTKIILVGDKDQLPSVGAGNVLSDILRSGVVPCVCLEFVYRQGKQSMIAFNAHKINCGLLPDLNSKDSDFFFAKVEKYEVAKVLLDMVTRRLPSYLGVDASKIQVLSALKNGQTGTIELNRTLQQLVNPYRGGQQIVDKDYTYRRGDRVMHIQNNYNLKWTRSIAQLFEEGQGVFNGDMGSIVEIKGTDITVLFDDGKVSVYSTEERSQLVLSYAITIHKSQGSEFDFVIMPIVGGSPTIMTRNLLYTGITRAKKMLVLIGEEYNIKRMIDNDYIALRYSALWYFLQKGAEQQLVD